MKFLNRDCLEKKIVKKSGGALNLAVFGSKEGTNLKAILTAQKKIRGVNVQVVVTDRKCNCQKIAQAENIPLIYVSYKKVKDNFPLTYDQIYEKKILEKLKEYQIDFIILAGYMRLVKDLILTAYDGKIINIHPADLTYTVNQKRVYVGANASALALRNGEIKTRSSVIFVDKGVDTGPILVSGPWVYYNGTYPIKLNEIEKHQKKQKFASDHMAITKALEILKNEKVFLEKGKIFINGSELKECGYEM